MSVPASPTLTATGITSSQAKQLSDGNPDGCCLGQSATDLISLFGATPIAQPGATVLTRTALINLGLIASGYAEAATITGTTAKTAGLNLAITDSSTCATGYNQVAEFSMTTSGVKTGDCEVHGIGIDIISTATVPYLYGETLYMNISGAGVVALAAWIEAYADVGGSGLGQFIGIDLGIAGTMTPSGRYAFIRMAAQSSSYTPKQMILAESQNNAPVATYFLDFQGSPSAPITASTQGAQTSTFKIACRYNSTAFFIQGTAA